MVAISTDSRPFALIIFLFSRLIVAWFARPGFFHGRRFLQTLSLITPLASDCLYIAITLLRLFRLFGFEWALAGAGLRHIVNRLKAVNQFARQYLADQLLD